jgi:hypothetical protein
VPKPFWPGLFMRDVKNGVSPSQSFSISTRTICRIRPKKNGGMERPTKDAPVENVSNREYWRMAEMLPTITPRLIVKMNANSPSCSVLPMASLRSGHTG